MFYYMLAFVMGLAIALQAPINAALARSLDNTPIMAAVVSFVIGSACLIAIAFFSHSLNFHTLKALTQQNWWKFLGGILGAFFVFGSIMLAPKIGLINMFILALMGQLVTSVVLDSIGAFELSVRAISWQKIVGLCVMFVGLGIFFQKELFSQ
ncbi:DMT family transporter [Helicobacter marmotae]|nr:DMT family transporter [Helicobacter marmotae]